MPCLQALRDAGVKYCVAPYEADAQMAYLSNAGLADVVITEDSDLLAYGCSEVRCCKHTTTIVKCTLRDHPVCASHLYPAWRTDVSNICGASFHSQSRVANAALQVLWR